MNDCVIILTQFSYSQPELTELVVGYAGLILGLRPANETRRYKVMPSLIDWAQIYNISWVCWIHLYICLSVCLSIHM